MVRRSGFRFWLDAWRSPVFVAGALTLALWSVAAVAKEKKDPDWIEFEISRDGRRAGAFGYKTVTGASGTIYTSSKLEMEGKRGSLQVRTLVERFPSGKIDKYKKYVGLAKADPTVIVFWYKDKLRAISKGRNSFTRDLTPTGDFGLVDSDGFHLFADLVALWKVKGVTSLDVLAVHKGEIRPLTMKPAGLAVLKDAKGAEVQVTRLHLRAKGVDIQAFVGDRPMFLGFQSAHVLMLRKGWSLVKGELPLAVPGEEGEKVKEGEEVKEGENTDTSRDRKGAAERPGMGECEKVEEGEKGEASGRPVLPD